MCYVISYSLFRQKEAMSVLFDTASLLLYPSRTASVQEGKAYASGSFSLAKWTSRFPLLRG